MITVFFDFDGTLVDSREGITASIQYALEEMGADVPAAEDLEWCIGPSLSESFAVLLGEGADIEEAMALYRENYDGNAMFDADLYDGLEEMFIGLQEMGARFYVATSKPQEVAQEIAEHFGLNAFIERVFGAELDGTRSDKTVLLHFAMDETKSDPAKTVMVGDRRFDIFGAKNNGLFNIGILWGFGSPDELREAEADMLAGHPTELPEIISDLLGIE